MDLIQTLPRILEKHNYNQLSKGKALRYWEEGRLAMVPTD